MNGYITVQEAAVKWGITPRQVQILCKANEVQCQRGTRKHSSGVL